MKYRVKEVAEITRITVRTLHHYDKMGLLKPEFVSESGYRFYNDNNLERLQQILFFKEIGFNLYEIKKILDTPSFDRKKALENHKYLLIKKKERLEQVIKTVEKTINSIKEGKIMKKKEMFNGFDMNEIEKHKEKYAEEVRQKWGHTDSYRESERKTTKYTIEDWERIQTKNTEIYQKIIDYMKNGPEDPDVQEGISEWRKSITENFYNCTPEIFRGLGEMYVSDNRFTEFYEKMKPGMALFMKKAIDFYCDNLNE